MISIVTGEIKGKKKECDLNQRDSNIIDVGTVGGRGSGPPRVAEIRGWKFKNSNKTIMAMLPFWDKPPQKKQLNRREKWSLLLPNVFF